MRLGLSVGPAGSVIVFDSGGYTDILAEAGPPLRLYDIPPRITRVDAAGSQDTTWGGRGSAPGAFGPSLPPLTSGSPGVAIAPDGTVYAADPFNGRIQAFTPQGQWVRSISTTDVPTWPFRDGIVDLAVDDAGTLFVLDIYRSGERADLDTASPPRIRRFDADGNEQSPIDIAGLGFIVDPDFDVAPDGGSYFVTTPESRTAACRVVHRIALDGTPMMSFALGADRSGGCGEPRIAADRVGNVFVVRDDALERYSADGQRTDRVGLPSLLGEGARALAVGRDGQVLVVSSQGLRRAWPAYDRPFVIDTYAETHTSEWRVELYPGSHLAGPRLKAVRLQTLGASWLNGFDGELGDSDQEAYSARFERRTRLPPGRHDVELSSGGAARLWAAGRLLIDSWHADAVTETRSFFTTGTGSTVIRLEVRGPVPDIQQLELDVRHAGANSIHRRFLPIAGTPLAHSSRPSLSERRFREFSGFAASTIYGKRIGRSSAPSSHDQVSTRSTNLVVTEAYGDGLQDIQWGPRRSSSDRTPGDCGEKTMGSRVSCGGRYIGRAPTNFACNVSDR